MRALIRWWNGIIDAAAAWHYREWQQPFTVACDKSPFWHPGNERERLFHCRGLGSARAIARRWVAKHQCGQARIIEGTRHHAP